MGRALFRTPFQEAEFQALDRKVLFLGRLIGRHRLSPFEQASHDGDIGRGKIITEEIRRVNPANLLVIMKLEITGEMCGPVGQQVYLPVGVGMKIAADKDSHDDVDAELLQQLPPEAGLGGLALFDFPAGEFPLVRQAVPSFAAGDEDPVRPFRGRRQ